VVQSLRTLRAHARATERACADEVAQVDPAQRASARNLLHYIALRQHDVRDLQAALTRLGLSSLGRSEAHVMASLETVLGVAETLAGVAAPESAPAVEVPDPGPRADFSGGAERLAGCTQALLGPAPAGRDVRIMVTMPREAASDAGLILALVEAGMDVMRVNCAHDDAPTWRAMVDNLARARVETGRACKVLFDLAGPKLRTGAVISGPRLVRVRPPRDGKGRNQAPARVWISKAGEVPEPAPPRWPADPEFPDAAPHRKAQEPAAFAVDGALLALARAGDRLRFQDTRDKNRKLRVLEVREGAIGAFCALDEGAWIEAGTPVELRRDGVVVGVGTLSPSGPLEERVLVRKGEALRIVRPGTAPAPPLRDEAGALKEPARVPCTLPEALRDARPGQRIFLDDGKLGGVIEAVDDLGILARIDLAPEEGLELGADKGINLPDTSIALPALTPKDLQDLDVAVALADMVALSFVRGPEDILGLVKALEEQDARDLGVVLKVETRAAFDGLPRILLAALRSPPVGIMVARGDLAVECGFERLAEVQEEILWMCEAAHLPVIWATQVLETLAKTGRPSRAEVTDAAMSGRAECVMLNKGPYIAEAVRFLDDVLRRMQSHQQKKRAMLRRLSISSLAPRIV